VESRDEYDESTRSCLSLPPRPILFNSTSFLSMAVPLSAADSTIIQHQVTLNSNLLASTSAQSGRDIDSLYDIQLTSKTLLDNRFKNVALQFPDELLIDSVPIFWALTDCLRRLQRRRRLQDQDTEKVSQEGLDSDSDLDLPNLYVLADTSYGK